MAPYLDRSEEFFRLRAKFGNAPIEEDEESKKNEKISPRVATPDNSMFFKAVASIQNNMAEARKGATQIQKIRMDAMQSVTKEQEETYSDQLTEVLNRTNSLLSMAKTTIDRLLTDPDLAKPNSTIQQKMHAALVRKFSDVCKAFHEQEQLYRKEVSQKAHRQLKIAFPNSSDGEIQGMVDEGMDTSTLVRQRMGGVHVSLLESLSNIQSRYADVRMLEQSMRDLNQMFLDMAKLIDYQGEMVDSIMHSVEKANENVVKGEKELKAAYRAMKRRRMCYCCTTLFALVIGAVVLIVVLNSNN